MPKQRKPVRKRNETAWSEDTWQDYLQWQREGAKIPTSINDLTRDIKRDPFKGLGKPESLEHALPGWWSRRITVEYRLVYRVSGKGEERQLAIVQCRYHY